MTIDIQKILRKVEGLEAMATTMQKEAAMLRRELSAGGQPVAPTRKGKHNEGLAMLAQVRYATKMDKATAK